MSQTGGLPSSAHTPHRQHVTQYSRLCAANAPAAGVASNVEIHMNKYHGMLCNARHVFAVKTLKKSYVLDQPCSAQLWAPLQSWCCLASWALSSECVNRCMLRVWRPAEDACLGGWRLPFHLRQSVLRHLHSRVRTSNVLNTEPFNDASL